MMEGFGTMGRKRDLKEVDAVADAFDMDDEERFAFGDFIEDCKAQGDRGTKNERGDFTRLELEEKAREFLGLPEEE
jgi:hypothetical protein